MSKHSPERPSNLAPGAPLDAIRASEARPLDAARDAAGELGAPFPSAPREAQSPFDLADFEMLRADRERDAQRREEQRAIDAMREHRAIDAAERTARAFELSALLDLHRLTSHAGAGDGRYLRAATKLGDELVASVERAFEG